MPLQVKLAIWAAAGAWAAQILQKLTAVSVSAEQPVPGGLQHPSYPTAMQLPSSSKAIFQQ